MRFKDALFIITSLTGLTLYSMFILVPFHSGPCFNGIHWCPDRFDPTISIIDQLMPAEWVLPVIPWGALVILGRQKNRHTLLSDIAVWISLGAIFLAGLTGLYFFFRYTASGIVVSNTGTTIQGTIDYANNVVDNSIKALLSGILLGCLISLVTPYLAELSVGLFLWVDNNLLRRLPPKSNVVSLRTQRKGNLPHEFIGLFYRSLFFSLTLAFIYSKLGFDPIFPAQSPAGMPVLVPGFVAIFFYSAMIPAIVHFAELGNYVIKHDGHPNKPFSEEIMRWTGIGSLAAIISILGASRSLDPFVSNPFSLLFAILTSMPVPFGIVGSCISISIFLPRLASSRKTGFLTLLSAIAFVVVLLYPFVVLYPVGLLNWLAAQGLTPIGHLVSKLTDFADGIFLFGFYWYPIALLAGIVAFIILVITGRVKSVRDIVLLALGALAGVILAFAPHALRHDSFWHLWVPVLQVLNTTVLIMEVKEAAGSHKTNDPE